MFVRLVAGCSSLLGVLIDCWSCLLTAGAPDHCFLALSVCAAAVGWLVGCCFVGLIGGFSCVGVLLLVGFAGVFSFSIEGG